MLEPVNPYQSPETPPVIPPWIDRHEWLVELGKSMSIGIAWPVLVVGVCLFVLPRAILDREINPFEACLFLLAAALSLAAWYLAGCFAVAVLMAGVDLAGRLL